MMINTRDAFLATAHEKGSTQPGADREQYEHYPGQDRRHHSIACVTR
jgi:hypothetical protein